MQLLCFWRWSSVHSTWTLCVVSSWSENNILLMFHVFCGNLSWLCTPSKCWTVILLQILSETLQCPALHVTNALLLVLGCNRLWRLCRWALHIHPLTLVALFCFEWKSGISNDLHFYICALNSVFMLSYKVHSLALSFGCENTGYEKSQRGLIGGSAPPKKELKDLGTLLSQANFSIVLMNQEIWKQTE